MKKIKISSLKKIIKQHEQKCHRRYGASWRAESILRRILETFCDQELNKNEVMLIDSWWDFLKDKCVPGSFIGQICVRQFKCLEVKDGNS